jgi:hypothetical protein
MQIKPGDRMNLCFFQKLELIFQTAGTNKQTSNYASVEVRLKEQNPAGFQKNI